MFRCFPHTRAPFRSAARRGFTAATGAAVLVAFPAFTAAADPPAPTPAPPAESESILLEGTLRDFLVSHPDMQFKKKNFGLKKKMVEDELGEDGRPVLTEKFLKKPEKGMVTSAETFAQWFKSVPGVNRTDSIEIELEPHPDKPGVMYFARERQSSGGKRFFFPADGKGYNDMIDAGYGPHNYYFTVTFETEFTYDDPDQRDHELEFAFSGDDDVWVFINGKLAVDLGGVHSQESDKVNLDKKAEKLGLEPGKTYPLTLFFAERHTTQSNFRIETTLKLRGLPPSVITANFD